MPKGTEANDWYLNQDFSEARTCVLLLSGAASDVQSLGAAGVTTSECGRSEVWQRLPPLV